MRARLDWKSVLRLAVDDGGFDASVLSEFRGRLLAHDATTRLFDTLLAWCRERGFVKAGGRQRTDSTDVWGAVRGLHRLELVIEAMRRAPLAPCRREQLERRRDRHENRWQISLCLPGH